MALESEIFNIINAQLPAQVGEALKKRLAQAEKDAADAETLRREISDVKRERNTLQEQVSQCRKLETLIKEQTEAAQKLRDAQTDDKIIKLQQEFAQARVSDMKEVVLAVFANSKLKYQEYSNRGLANGCSVAESKNGEVEK